MASALLKGYRFVAAQPSKRLHYCGCRHISAVGSNDDGGRFSRRPRYKLHSGRSFRKISVSSPPTTWLISNIHNKSRFIHSSTIFTNLNLCEDLLVKRTFHSTAYVFKENSGEEISKDKVKNGEKDETKPAELTVKEESGDKSLLKKGYAKLQHFRGIVKENGIIGTLMLMMRHIKEASIFYWQAFKLFRKDVYICIPLGYKYLRYGRSSLTWKEYRLLKHTFVDLLKMIPFLPAIVIPFLEILIPVLMSFGMIPRGFISKEKKEKQHRALYQRKLEAGKFLTESLSDMVLKSKSKDDEMQEFARLMEKVKDDNKMVPIADIIKFARLFENSVTLDDLSIDQLRSICKLLGIGFMSDIRSERLLRFQIDMRMRELTADDKFIVRDGIDSMTIDELQSANRKRGMRAYGLPEERLRFQLHDWLHLHLTEQIPTTLLLLSRVSFLNENLTQAERLKKVFSIIPESTFDKVKVSSAESSESDKVDRLTKISVREKERMEVKSEKTVLDTEEKALEEKVKLQYKIDEVRKGILKQKKEIKKRFADQIMTEEDHIMKEYLEREKNGTSGQMDIDRENPVIKSYFEHGIEESVEKKEKEVREAAYDEIERMIKVRTAEVLGLPEEDAQQVKKEKVLAEKQEEIQEKPGELLKDTAEDLEKDSAKNVIESVSQDNLKLDTEQLQNEMKSRIKQEILEDGATTVTDKDGIENLISNQRLEEELTNNDNKTVKKDKE